MSRRKEPGMINFWPGYVDALTNVVLNLLFMVALFCVSLSVVSMSTEKPLPDRPRASPAAGPTPPMTPPPSQRSASIFDRLRPPPEARSYVPATPVPTQRASPAGGVAGGAEPRSAGLEPPASAELEINDGRAPLRLSAVSVRKLSDAGGRTVVQILYPLRPSPQAASLDAATIASLRRLLPQGQATTVWTVTNLRDPAARKAAYLKLSQTRALLIRGGWRAEDIQLRLLNGQTYTGATPILVAALNSPAALTAAAAATASEASQP